MGPSLFGIVGLVCLAFGLVGLYLVGPHELYPVINLIAGVGLIGTYLAVGFEHFRSVVGQRSTRYGASSLLYSGLFILLLGGLNFVSVRRHHRWDVTEASIYTLSPQSKKIVESLKEDLSITAFVEGGQSPQVETLLESYRYAGPAHVKFKLVDPDKEPTLIDKMKITAAPSVHLAYGAGTPGSDKEWKEAFVVQQPTEENLTNGIIRISGEAKKTVYFAEGDGEARLDEQQDPKGYAGAKLALEQENYDVKTLTLPSIDKIPDDASAVILAGPTRPLTDNATSALDAYLKRGGHVLAMVPPRVTDEKLTKLLDDFGAKIGNDIVVDQQMTLFQGPRLGVEPLSKTYGTHPITQDFKDFTSFPQTRTVEPATEGKKGLTATALVKTSATSWAETNVDDIFTKGVASKDPAEKQGPLSIGVAVEAKLADLGATPPAAGEGKKGPEVARLVVFGTAGFANNQKLSQLPQNADLFLNSVSWLVGQEELVSIRNRSVRASRAELTPAQALNVFLYSVLVVPQLLTVAGLVVWWRRRSR